MTYWWSAARLAVGGAALGVPLGIFLGGGLGGIYGYIYNDYGVGLDAALVGATAVSMAGAVYGITLGRRDQPRSPFSVPDRGNVTIVG